jgi:hypothetical protein
MKRNSISIIIGVLLVLGGLLFLLENFNLVTLNFSIFFALLFAAGGAIFLAVFASDSQQWWALIPGFSLLAIGGLIALPMISPFYADRLGGPLFLGAIALAFWLIYAVKREYWWAVIPAGSLTTLAVVAGLSVYPALDQYSGGVFFLGMALTFGLLTILPVQGANLRWALYPAGVMLVLSVIVLASASALMSYVWPVALIVGGIALIFFTRRPRLQ